MTILKYTLFRIALIAAFMGLFYVLGMRSYLLAATSIVCAFMAAYLFLPKVGDAAASDVERLMTRSKKPRRDDLDEDSELA